MKTNYAYINEFGFLDDLIDCINESTNDVAVRMYDYNNKLRETSTKAFFEGVNEDVFMEKEKEGVLATIGKGIITLIEKIKEAITKLTEAIVGKSKEAESEAEVVNRIIEKHPELKNKVCEGIQKEWFTYKDVATYEKDVIGLINMLEKNAIDHRTFKDKMQAAADKFEASAKPIIAIGTTIGALVGLVGTIGLKSQKAKGALKSLGKTTEKFKQDFDKNKNTQNANVFSSAFNALGQAIGLVTKECQHRAKSQGFLCNLFKLFNKKHGGGQQTP